jgi:hypothetical protein
LMSIYRTNKQLNSNNKFPKDCQSKKTLIKIKKI